MGLFSNNRFLSSLSARGAKGRPPFEAFYIYILAVLIGLLISDLGILFVRPSLLPTQPPPVRPQRMVQQPSVSEQQFSKIITRNMFNIDGKIPPALTSDGSPGGPDMAPVASQLPLKLEGTLVHLNPKKSVASIASKTKGDTVEAYMVDHEIENMARITAIERRKVIFRNLNNNRLEYIEIPKDTAVTFGVKDPNAGSVGIQSTNQFEFTVDQSEIAKHTADLGAVLQQARMVPNIVPGSGGRVEGFRFVAIQPGSVYEKLGFKPMDVIKKVNNDDVNSPTKAMELYNALKTEGRIQLTVERNGRDETFIYNVNR